LNLKMLVLVYTVLKDLLRNPESGNIAKLSQIHTLLLRLISVITMTFSCKMHCRLRFISVMTMTFSCKMHCSARS